MAFIDLGTNSIPTAGGPAERSRRVHGPLRAEGDRPARGGRVRDGPPRRCGHGSGRPCCGPLRRLARSFGAEEIVAVATSAAREARNRDVLISRLRTEAGLDVHVIPGLEEARLIYLGVSERLRARRPARPLHRHRGRSTEFAVGTAKDHIFLSSVKLGSLRLRTSFRPGGPAERTTRQATASSCASTADWPCSGPSRTSPPIGGRRSSDRPGPSQALAEVAERMTGGPGRGRAPNSTAPGLRAAVRLLAPLSLEERRTVPGLAPSRADIIVPGAAILETIFECLGIDSLRTTTRGLKEGLLVDHLSRRGLLPAARRSAGAGAIGDAACPELPRRRAALAPCGELAAAALRFGRRSVFTTSGATNANSSGMQPASTTSGPSSRSRTITSIRSTSSRTPSSRDSISARSSSWAWSRGFTARS